MLSSASLDHVTLAEALTTAVLLSWNCHDAAYDAKRMLQVSVSEIVGRKDDTEAHKDNGMASIAGEELSKRERRYHIQRPDIGRDVRQSYFFDSGFEAGSDTD